MVKGSYFWHKYFLHLTKMAIGYIYHTFYNIWTNWISVFCSWFINTFSIHQLSKYFLDPRRPVSQSAPREEGLIPYMPELPLPPQEMINYNNSLPRVNAIFTAATGLESTCLVLVYGLGKKTFNMVKQFWNKKQKLLQILLPKIIVIFVVAKMGHPVFWLKKYIWYFKT